ncbi:MAG: hypothetical protein H5U40_13080, partial [Polyangiaceae bacterium]|nr:hypothetical protein [Polyangiaceae bacterium]
MIDRALLGLRRGGAATAWRALFGGSLVAWVLLTAYYFEEVEGVRSLRPAFGMLLVLAFWGRAYFLAQVARSVVVPLLPKGAALPEMRFFDVARTASVVAIGLFFWSWLPVVGSYIGLAAAAASLAPLCLRGAIAPTWLARAGVEAGGGVMAFVAAFRDLGRERGKGVLIELMLLLGIVVVCANLVAAMGAVSLLARSFLGLDIAVVEAFFSTDNTFVLLVLGAISAVALEPLRAAVSAVLYVEARARRDGFDLAAAVRALAPLGSRGAGAALVLTLSLGVCSFAVAQEPPSDMPAAEHLEDEALTPRDWAVLDGVD